jgi:hypothetical protein
MTEAVIDKVACPMVSTIDPPIELTRLGNADLYEMMETTPIGGHLVKWRTVAQLTKPATAGNDKVNGILNIPVVAGDVRAANQLNLVIEQELDVATFKITKAVESDGIVVVEKVRRLVKEDDLQRIVLMIDEALLKKIEVAYFWSVRMISGTNGNKQGVAVGKEVVWIPVNGFEYFRDVIVVSHDAEIGIAKMLIHQREVALVPSERAIL